MSQYGINVPPGIPITKLEEVKPAADEMARGGEVWKPLPLSRMCAPKFVGAAEGLLVRAAHSCKSCKHIELSTNYLQGFMLKG